MNLFKMETLSTVLTIAIGVAVANIVSPILYALFMPEKKERESVVTPQKNIGMGGGQASQLDI